MLLAADLGAVVQAVQISPEEQPQTATVLVINNGPDRVSNAPVAVHASQVASLDPSDVSIGTGRVHGNLRPGEAKGVAMNVNFSSLAPGAYHILGSVNDVGTGNAANNVGIGPMVLKDADGTVALFSLRGPGQSNLVQDGSQWHVGGTGTTAQSLGFPAASSPSAPDIKDRGMIGEYAFQSLDFPAASNTVANDINNQGMIVGSYETADFRTLGFTWNKGDFVTVDVPDSLHTALNGVNNAGSIVGNYGAFTEVGPIRYGFLQTNNRFETIAGPGAEIFTTANKVNEAGQVVGHYIDSTLTTDQQYFHGFIWDKGTLTTIDFPDATITNLTGINSKGDIVGYWQNPEAGLAYGFLRDKNGNITNLGDNSPTDINPGTYAPSDINDQGTIVGFFSTGADLDSLTFHGFIRDKEGHISIINYPGARDTMINGVNNKGQFVGSYTIDDGTGGRLPLHGFLMWT